MGVALSSGSSSRGHCPERMCLSHAFYVEAKPQKVETTQHPTVGFKRTRNVVSKKDKDERGDRLMTGSPQRRKRLSIAHLMPPLPPPLPTDCMNAVLAGSSYALKGPLFTVKPFAQKVITCVCGVGAAGAAGAGGATALAANNQGTFFTV